MLRAEPRITEAFKSGGGMRWGEHDPDLFVGTERFFWPGSTAYLTSSWIPARTNRKPAANVADIGCGPRAPTIILAKAFFHASMVSTHMRRRWHARVKQLVTAADAGRTRLPAGVQYPSDVTAGLELERIVASLVI